MDFYPQTLPKIDRKVGLGCSALYKPWKINCDNRCRNRGATYGAYPNSIHGSGIYQKIVLSICIISMPMVFKNQFTCQKIYQNVEYLNGFGST